MADGGRGPTPRPSNRAHAGRHPGPVLGAATALLGLVVLWALWSGPVDALAGVDPAGPGDRGRSSIPEPPTGPVPPSSGAAPATGGAGSSGGSGAHDQADGPGPTDQAGAGAASSVPARPDLVDGADDAPRSVGQHLIVVVPPHDIPTTTVPSTTVPTVPTTTPVASTEVPPTIGATGPPTIRATTGSLPRTGLGSLTPRLALLGLVLLDLGWLVLVLARRAADRAVDRADARHTFHMNGAR